MDQLLALRAFGRVVEAGSFTRAADSLNMPNATLSKLVRELETHLGVRLLQRTTRRVTVTPEGRDYYENRAHPGRPGRDRHLLRYRPRQAAWPATHRHRLVDGQ